MPPAGHPRSDRWPAALVRRRPDRGRPSPPPPPARPRHGNACRCAPSSRPRVPDAEGTRRTAKPAVRPSPRRRRRRSRHRGSASFARGSRRDAGVRRARSLRRPRARPRRGGPAGRPARAGARTRRGGAALGAPRSRTGPGREPESRPASRGGNRRLGAAAAARAGRRRSPTGGPRGPRRQRGARRFAVWERRGCSREWTTPSAARLSDVRGLRGRRRRRAGWPPRAERWARHRPPVPQSAASAGTRPPRPQTPGGSAALAKARSSAGRTCRTSSHASGSAVRRPVRCLWPWPPPGIPAGRVRPGHRRSVSLAATCERGGRRWRSPPGRPGRRGGRSPARSCPTGPGGRPPPWAPPPPPRRRR